MYNNYTTRTLGGSNDHIGGAVIFPDEIIRPLTAEPATTKAPYPVPIAELPRWKQHRRTALLGHNPNRNKSGIVYPKAQRVPITRGVIANVSIEIHAG